MKYWELLHGQKIKYMTEIGVEVELEIASIKENRYSEDLAPATKENDWYPPQRYWGDFTVTTSTGKSFKVDSLDKLNLIKPT